MIVIPVTLPDQESKYSEIFTFCVIVQFKYF